MENDYFEQGEGELLIVAFTSINDGIAGLKRFEFMNSVGRSDTKVLFIKDSSITWYQTGIAGVPGGMEGLVAFLRAERAKHRRCVSLGYSAGAYASLLFSRLAEFDLSVAICPQIDISQDFRASIKDIRWEHLLGNAYSSGLSEYANLSEIYSSPQTNESVIVYGAADQLDILHINHLKSHADMDKIHLIEIAESNHNTCIAPLREADFFQKFPAIAADAQDGSLADAVVRFFEENVPSARTPNTQ